MPLQLTYSIISVLVFFSFLICGFLALSAAGRGNNRGEFYFSISMAAAAIYNIFYFWELHVPILEVKETMLKLQYVGAVFIAPFFWLFVNQFIAGKKLSNWTVATILIVPVFHLIAALSNDLHHLLFSDTQLNFGNKEIPFWMSYANGPIYWTHSIYSGAMVLIGFGQLFRFYFRVTERYKRQIGLLLLGFVLSIFVYFFSLSDAFQTVVDPLVFSFAITGLILYLAVIKYGFLNEMPVAFQTLFDTFNRAILVVNNFGLVTTFNSSAEMVFKLDRSKIGVALEIIFKKWPEFLKWLQNDGESEIILRVPDDLFSDVLFFSIKCLPVDGNKDKNGVLLIFEDVTDSILQAKSTDAAMLKLTQSEQRFRNLVENIDDSIFVLNRNGHFNYLSPNVKNRFGLDLNGLLGAHFSVVVQDKNSAELYRAFDDLIKNKKAVKGLKIPYKKPDGAIIWVQINASPSLDEEGLVEHVIGLASDITEEILVQERLIASERDAKKLAKQYEEVLNNQSVFFIKIGSNRSLTYFNQYFAENIWAFDIPKNLHIENIFQSKTPQRIDKLLDIAFANPGKPYSFVAYITSYSGVARGIKWDLKAVKYDHEDLVEIIGVGIDITEQLENLKTTKNLLRTTVRQNEQLRNFTYITSHNIRSHAVNFMGLINLMKEANTLEEFKDYTDLMSQNARSLDETLRNLNEVLSIHNNASRATKKIQLKSFAEAIVKGFEVQLKEIEADVQVKIPEELTLEAIPDYFQSILYNLIHNAIRYKKPQTPLELSISTRIDSEALIIQITDNGLGIDLEKHGHKIFGFYQTFHNKREDARGFGLFITKAKVDAMGGEISVESTLNKGTTFFIRFPFDRFEHTNP